MNTHGTFIPNGYMSGPDALYRYLLILNRDETNAVRHLLDRKEKLVAEDQERAKQTEGNVVFLPSPSLSTENLLAVDHFISSWRQRGERGVRELLFSGTVVALTVDAENQLIEVPKAFWASARADGVLFSETVILREGNTPEVFFLSEPAFSHVIATIYAEMAEAGRAKDTTNDQPDADANLKASLISRGPGRPGSLKDQIKAKMRFIERATLSKMTWKELHRAVGEIGTRTTLTEARKEVLAEVPETP